MRMHWCVVLLVPLVGCVSQKAFDSKSKEALTLKQQYDEQQEQLKALEQQLGESRTAADKTQKENAELESSLSSSDAERRALRKRVDELSDLNQELSRSTEKLAAAKEALEKKSSEYENLAKSLKEEIKTGKIELSELKGRMVVKMKDKILFSSGSTKLNKEGQDALAKVAQALKDVQGKIIRVEGHTDNVPVPTDAKTEFDSNWELSTTRALVVVKLLQEQGVPPTMLSALGYGEYQPIASNQTADGRSLNRRIEIVLAPAEQAPSAVVAASVKKAPAPTPAPVVKPASGTKPAAKKK
ncbi:Flagellar motor rotation protein MotB [Cystobacter fuscus DSM 2262]|uniref:Flagellar motor rotation protein MotB n=1 Tax=Cystobacter fuscus (strain ATCC 25194 / DSM 2262 / NBRC 100088 / M29) TaxID=1242864 RepID=S9PJU2_CYSF2|nr:OmpA family protein [Cystobacter fuscus]EPX64540.1 Flagellar motor rotation protein MotB [Cystobacter fuscus DSM 2262]